MSSSSPSLGNASNANRVEHLPSSLSSTTTSTRTRTRSDANDDNDVCFTSSWTVAFATAADLKLAEGLDDNDIDNDVEELSSSSSTVVDNSGFVEMSKIAATTTAAATATKATALLLKQQFSNNKETKTQNCKPRKTTRSSDNDDMQPDHDDGEETRPHKQQRPNNNNNNTDYSSSSSSDDALFEGRMVHRHPRKSSDVQQNQIMVLIDTKRRIVYDGMKRTCSGNHVRIGSLDTNGGICWDDDDDDVLQDDETAETNDDRMQEQQRAQATGRPPSVSFPFPTSSDDHCETPLEAYQDILPLLERLCHRRRDRKKDLVIYDPYYCNGSVKRNLAKLGFTDVYNQKVDCYQVWSSTSTTKEMGCSYPNFDVLITNPPYSDDHMPKLLQHIMPCRHRHCHSHSPNSKFGSNRPWFLLLPTWVHKKDYYKDRTESSGIKPFYLIPKKRYTYIPPKQFRPKKVSDVHKKSSPFVSMWYIWGGSPDVNEDLIRHYYWYQQQQQGGNGRSCDLARSKSALRDLRRRHGKQKK